MMVYLLMTHNTKREFVIKQYHLVLKPENEHEQLPQLNDNYTSIQDIQVTVNAIKNHYTI